MKLKRHSNISTGDLTIKKNASLDKKIIKPRVKPTSYITSKLKINQAKTKKSKTSRKFTSYNLKKEYYQLENQLKKAESDTRYYLKSYLKCEIQKKVLEMKLNAYMCLEEEYEELN